MNRFLNYENKFFKTMDWLVDCMLASLIWLLFSIPFVITFGAASTAFYYVMNKSVRHGRGYLWKEFLSSFKNNFKQATVVWLLIEAVGAVILFAYYVMSTLAKAGDLPEAAVYIYPALLILLLMAGLYYFPYIARFESSLKDTLRIAPRMALANFPTTLLVAGVFLAAMYAEYRLLPLLIIVPGLSLYLISILLERVFVKYMSSEDLAAEKRRNEDQN